MTTTVSVLDSKSTYQASPAANMTPATNHVTPPAKVEPKRIRMDTSSDDDFQMDEPPSKRSRPSPAAHDIENQYGNGSASKLNKSTSSSTPGTTRSSPSPLSPIDPNVRSGTQSNSTISSASKSKPLQAGTKQSSLLSFFAKSSATASR
jgi:hypothetical protein